MKSLKIVFFGTPDFAVASLDALVGAGHNVAAVVTATDKVAGRGKKLTPPAVKLAAERHGIPVMQPEKLKDPGFVDELRSIGADLFVVIAFRMLPEVVWAMPPMGTFNLHASLLPRYRGAAPINWAVINGETETGVTTFFLKHEIDTGDVISSERIEILPSDNAGTVHDRLMEIGARLTVDTVDRIAAGGVEAVPQMEMEGDAVPCPAPKIFKETCHLDFTAPAVRVHNLIRGLSPYPGAWADAYADGEEAGILKIFETRVTDVKSEESGRVRITGMGTFTVDCGDVRLEVLALQAQGKRRMTTDEYLRGIRWKEMILS